MSTTTKKISNINDELDVKLFLYIARHNILYPIVFIIVAFCGAFLYLRYTPPVYQTSAIIQLSSENQANRILPTATIYDDDIAKQIELLRSSVFLQRSFSRLPLDMSYYSKGRFLNSEIFRNAPFRIEYKVKNPAIFGIPIYLDFISTEKYSLSYTIPGLKPNKQEYLVNQVVQLPEIELKLEIGNYNAIVEQQSTISKNSYFIVVNNPENLVAAYAPGLKVSVMNAAAKTIQISYVDKNAQKASDIVNTIAEEFNVYDLEKKAESANNILDFIDKQLDMVFSKLSESEIELDAFKRTYNIDETAITPVPTIQGRINDLESQIIDMELESRIFGEIEKNLRNEKDIDIYKLIAILAGSEFQGHISGLLTTLQDQLLQREKLLYEVTPNSSQIESLNYQIEIQKKLLVESIGTLKNNIQSRILDLNNKIEDYEVVVGSRSGRYNMIEFTRLQRIYSINERFYNQLVEKKAEYSIAKAGYVSQNAILERSRTPSKPISPIARNVYTSSLLAALFLGIGIILLKYLFYNEIPSLHDVLKYTSAPILGVIPKYKSEIPPNKLLVVKKPKSLIAEALRSIRTNLQFINNDPGSKIVAVTSTISGEGKTFFAMNLAGILAFSDKKVIVIDLDMRKPKIHLGFNVENQKGVSTILSGIDNVESCIQSSRVRNLDFITAGPVPPNPSELILKPNMDEMIVYLKNNYDFVIVDNPPVGIVTDGMKSILMADYPIYVFKANYSKRVFIQNVNRLIDDSNLHNMSIVLNAVDREYSSYGYDKGYAYGYYGGYGYGYGYYEELLVKDTNKPWFKKLIRKRS